MGNYDDIINLPHHVSRHHPQMSMHDRAAQFAPFAALTGHSEAIAETARLTERKVELDEYEKEKLDEKLLILQALGEELPEITVTYFCPDGKKEGGCYKTEKKVLRRISETRHTLVMEDGTEIRIDDILDLSCEQMIFFDQ
ncbi:MAG: hypothetical protein SOZ59_09560 [Candidatus Limivivens sp.]|nr:hypothetical protein [Candidatus Limivivens sp.]